MNDTRPRRSRRLLPVILLTAVAVLGAFGIHQSLSMLLPHTETSASPLFLGPPGVDDGVVPENGSLSPFDENSPAVTGLDPMLLSALRRAAEAAAVEEVDVRINSGWRSARYQEQLLDEAVVLYNSREEAARWVATAETSAHVTGDGVDVGPFDAAYWLSLNGSAYGLCQIYANEPWHFELRPDAIDDGCPPQYSDPTDDPRMQQ